jgi:hypothetical protein
MKTTKSETITVEYTDEDVQEILIAHTHKVLGTVSNGNENVSILPEGYTVAVTNAVYPKAKLAATPLPGALSKIVNAYENLDKGPTLEGFFNEVYAEAPNLKGTLITDAARLLHLIIENYDPSL